MAQRLFKVSYIVSRFLQMVNGKVSLSQADFIVRQIHILEVFEDLNTITAVVFWFKSSDKHLY